MERVGAYTTIGGKKVFAEDLIMDVDRKTERVFHINGNPCDNRKANLVVGPKFGSWWLPVPGDPEAVFTVLYCEEKPPTTIESDAVLKGELERYQWILDGDEAVADYRNGRRIKRVRMLDVISPPPPGMKTVRK